YPHYRKPDSGCQNKIGRHESGLVKLTNIMLKRRGYPPELILAATLCMSGAVYGQDFFRELGTSRSSGGLAPVMPTEYDMHQGAPSGMRRVTPLTEGEEDSKYNV